MIKMVSVKRAVSQMAALAQETRLQGFLLLVQSGASGVMQGEVARRLKIPPQTLSFHLKQLVSAGLIRSRREGTAIYYSADFEEARRLADFVSRSCCIDIDRKAYKAKSPRRKQR